MKRRNKDLSQGNIKKQLINLVWPMLFGMVGMVIFNLADTYFIGRLGVQELAAISFSFPVVMFINSLSLGIGIGTSSLISRHIIVTERHAVKMMASRALLLGIMVVLIFVITGLFTIRPLFTALGAEGIILKYVSDYMHIWYLGVPFVVFPMIGNNIVRATGDTFMPGMLMLNSAIINVILDPLLIFGYGFFPRMGIQGAALATVFARGVSFVLILTVLIKREKLLTIRLGRFREILATWKKVLYVAGPAALGMLITPLSLGLITRILSGFGKEAVAAFGVASRVEMFALMVIASLGSVLIIFIGQNYSKQKFNRIFAALRYALGFSMVWGVLIFLILLLFGRNIAGVFTNDSRVVAIAASFFLIVGSSYGFQGLVMLSTASYNGLNRPYPAVFFSMLRMLILYVPLAWIGATFFALEGVFWAGFTANIIAGSTAYAFLYRCVKRIEKQIDGSCF
ncbi:MATE family efflux transporter [Fidelibacter multiformis]|jgi:putative MATE family efflux protein|uniref:MATE family efflux transporter n=1 Tax=Fidelibacter multiformis TaxID=3377529 RepID=UPI0037DCDA3D